VEAVVSCLAMLAACSGKRQHCSRNRTLITLINRAGLAKKSPLHSLDRNRPLICHNSSHVRTLPTLAS
jgi:hypothetical protein